MFKRIRSLMRQDLANALRDNLLIYMIVAPLLLAVAARLFLPSLEGITVTFAVDGSSVETAVIDQLHQYGNVELLDSRADVVARVNRVDDIPGIVRDGDTYTVILEGNEPEGAAVGTAVLQTILAGDSPTTYETVALSEGQSLVTEYGAIALLMLAVMMGAVVAGFIMVDEKESNAIRALAVSPLTLGQFTLARLLFALGLSTIIAFGSSLIVVGTAVNYGLLLIGCVVASGVAILVGSILGIFSDNQVQAVALIKVLMLVYMTLPFVTVFIPRNWHWPFYVLPNYWLWQTFENLFIGQMGVLGYWGSAAVTAVLSLVGVLALVPFFRSRLKLRVA